MESEEPVIEDIEEEVDAGIEDCPVCQDLPIRCMKFSSCDHRLCMACMACITFNTRGTALCPLCREPLEGAESDELVDQQVRLRLGDELVDQIIAEQDVELGQMEERAAHEAAQHMNMAQFMADLGAQVPMRGPDPPQRVDPNTALMNILIGIAPQIIERVFHVVDNRVNIRTTGFYARYAASLLQMIAFILIAIQAVQSTPNTWLHAMSPNLVIIFCIGHMIREIVRELT